MRKAVLALLAIGAMAGISTTSAEAYGGCGPGWHPTPWGACRPNYHRYYGGPVYFGGPVYGYRHHYWGRPYWHHRHYW